MSDTKSCTASSDTPNTFLANLRKFKFHKKTSLHENNIASKTCPNENAAPEIYSAESTSGGDPVNDSLFDSKSSFQVTTKSSSVAASPHKENSPSPGKRRNGVKPGNRGVKRQQSLDVDEEGRTSVENALKHLSESFPGQDLLILQDALCRADWDVEKAKSALCKSLSNGNVEKRPKKIGKKKRRIEIDSDEEDYDIGDDDDGHGFKKRKVFDSDADSDEEVSDELSGDKRKVWEFLSEADSSELQQIPQCSKKKADLIIECRPFEGWKDLVEKLENKNGLGVDILNSVQVLLETRESAAELIKKCGKLASKLEAAVAAGRTNVKSQPSILSQNLKLSGYQLVGLNWLLVMNSQQVNAILADEMGLGKTVQIIAFLSHLKEKDLNSHGKPHLIVVPSSTLDNWQNEFQRWCPVMNVSVYHGSQEDRKYQRIDWSKNGFGDTEVVLTTYGMITSCPEEKKMFRVVPFNYAIFDEAHMLKNMYSQRYESLVKINAPHRVLITGTPLQNNLLELMSLLSFIMPKMFKVIDDKALKALFNKAPKQQSNSNGAVNSVSVFERTQISQAKHIMKPFVLRRLKCDVLKDLPKKTEEVIRCCMTKDQEEKYKDLVKMFSKQAVKELQDENSEPSESGMAMYMKLRRLANHPLLLRYHFKDNILRDMAKRLQTDETYRDTVFDYIFQDLLFFSDFELHQTCLNHKTCYSLRLPSSVMGQSGKVEEIERLLPKLKDGGHRVLLFSQFVIVLDVLEEHFKNKGYKYLRLDGSTPVTIRQELIDQYNRDDSILIFMLSTRAGGLGINLTSADTVIIHDVDPNPHNDKQAEDRCHRIGQTRPVRVIRLVSKGTIEENILSLAQGKLLLEREVSCGEENDLSEKKSVARLLKQALGLDNNSPYCSKSPSKPNT